MAKAEGVDAEKMLAIFLAVGTDTRDVPVDRADIEESWHSRSLGVRRGYLLRARRLLRAWHVLTKKFPTPR